MLLTDWMSFQAWRPRSCSIVCRRGALLCCCVMGVLLLLFITPVHTHHSTPYSLVTAELQVAVPTIFQLGSCIKYLCGEHCWNILTSIQLCFARISSIDGHIEQRI